MQHRGSGAASDLGRSPRRGWRYTSGGAMARRAGAGHAEPRACAAATGASLVTSVLVVFEDGEETLLKVSPSGICPSCSTQHMPSARPGCCQSPGGDYPYEEEDTSSSMARREPRSPRARVTNHALVMRTPDDATYRWRAAPRKSGVRTTGRDRLGARLRLSTSTFALPLFTLSGSWGLGTDFRIMAAIRHQRRRRDPECVGRMPCAPA
jgi:hypothetical protein